MYLVILFLNSKFSLSLFLAPKILLLMLHLESFIQSYVSSTGTVMFAMIKSKQPNSIFTFKMFCRLCSRYRFKLPKITERKFIAFHLTLQNESQTGQLHPGVERPIIILHGEESNPQQHFGTQLPLNSISWTIQAFCLNVCVYAALHCAIRQEANFNQIMIGKVHLFLLHAACITSQSPTSSAMGNLKLKKNHSRGLISFIYFTQESWPQLILMHCLGFHTFKQQNLIQLVNISWRRTHILQINAFSNLFLSTNSA